MPKTGDNMFRTIRAKQDHDLEEEKTLDLLDELTYTIHSTRANVLAARKRRYEKRLEKRKEKAKMNNRRNRGTFIDESETDREINEMFSNIADEFEAPAPKDLKAISEKKKKAARDSNEDDETLEQLGKLSIAGGTEAAEAKAEAIRKSGNVITKDLKVKYNMTGPPPEKNSSTPKLFMGAKGSYQSNDQLKNDLMSAQVFQDFRDELTTWFSSNPAYRNDVDSRGDMADYLTDKYLCRGLDPLPPSKAVSATRRNISTIVEDLGSNNTLSHDWAEKVFAKLLPEQEADYMKDRVDKLMVQDEMKERIDLIEEKVTGKKKKKKRVDADGNRIEDDEDDQSVASQGSKSVRIKDGDEGVTENNGEGGAQRGKPKSILKKDPDQERLRIKKQYEMYKAKKTQLEDEGAPDDERAVQHKELQDDIRSLLSTIQTTTR